MKIPERREVGRALVHTQAGRITDALVSMRRLHTYDAGQASARRRDRASSVEQLPLPEPVGGPPPLRRKPWDR